MLGSQGIQEILVAEQPLVNQSPFDAYAPAQIAEKMENLGVAKARLGALQTILLGILAGAFISFGAMLFTLVISDSVLGLGPTRLLGGVAFSLGLVLVVIAGAELFTGNNLIVMAWADGRVSTWSLTRNWTLVYVGNLIVKPSDGGVRVVLGCPRLWSARRLAGGCSNRSSHRCR